MVKAIYNNRWAGLAGVSIVYLIEHLQLMSYMKHARDDDDKTWNTDANDVWDGLEDVSLRYDDDSQTALYIIAMVLVVLVFFTYVILFSWIHKKNKEQDSFLSVMIWLLDHVVFGLGFIPIVANLETVTYCTVDGKIVKNSNYDCWDSTQSVMIFFGFMGISGAYIMSGVVFPILKSERNGVEKRWQYESYFYPMLRLLQVGIVLLFCPMKRPWVGAVLNGLLFAYLIVYECFKELHVASLRAGILFAQMWIFVAATAGSESDSSDMLVGWPLFLIGGYLIMVAKILIFKRKTLTFPIEK